MIRPNCVIDIMNISADKVNEKVKDKREEMTDGGEREENSELLGCLFIDFSIPSSEVKGFSSDPDLHQFVKH